MDYIIIIVLVIVAMKCLEKWLDESKKKKADTAAANELDQIDYTQAYQARYLLTRNEWQQYKKLRELTDPMGLIVCPKVRLLDLVEPRKGEKKYKTLLYKIQAKHVDFVICDQDLHIKAILELDDGSHDSQDRKDRDEFLDKVLTGTGYKVIHTRYIGLDTLSDL